MQDNSVSIVFYETDLLYSKGDTTILLLARCILQTRYVSKYR